MREYQLDLAATEDLRRLFHFIALDNPAAAADLNERLKQVFTLLASNPLMGERRRKLGVGIRTTTVGNYVIYFRAQEDRVQILRVIHGAQDIDTLWQQQPLP